MKSSRAKKGTDLSPAKRRVFFLIMVFAPVLFFVFAELLLRLVKYGPDLSLFTTETIRRTTYHIANPQVKSRYFSRVDFNPTSSPDYFLVPKPTGAYRIFCLGGSTTVGYPYWYNGSFSSFLRDRLRATFPQKRIEIINVGMTATNSFTVLDMARDLVSYEPDLFIVYDGHNEFYGALGIASHESLGASRWLINTYLRLVHFRTFLLLRDLYNGIGRFMAGETEPGLAGTMMERLALGSYIPYGSEEYRNALAMFRENLRDLCTLASVETIPVILASQVSNLRDQPPFISGNSPQLSPPQLASFNLLFNQAAELRLDGRPDSALSVLRGASNLDSTRADLFYEIARCLDSLGRRGEAWSRYIRARDLDQLRFRTSSDFNDAIAGSADEGRSIFVDMEAVFRAHSPDSLIGQTLITEHLHPNSRGYFLMAKAYACAIREKRLLADSAEWAVRDTVSDDILWQNRAVTDLDELMARRRTDILTSGWPFRPGDPIVDAVPSSDTLGQIVEQVTRGRLDWPGAHDRAADYYLQRGERQKAVLEYAAIINQIPLDVRPYLKLARLGLDMGNINLARAVLLASLDIEKTILAFQSLGDIALDAGKPDEAAAYYEKLPAFPQSNNEKLENGYKLALAYAQSGETDKAAARLLEILKLKPDYAPAINLLVKLKSTTRK